MSRLQARRDLADTELKFQGVLYERGLAGSEIATIRSKGDEALFGGRSTDAMKTAWKVPKSRPLSDFAPEVIVIAKQLGAAMTTHNTQVNNLTGERAISGEHQEQPRQSWHCPGDAEPGGGCKEGRTPSRRRSEGA